MLSIVTMFRGDTRTFNFEVELEKDEKLQEGIKSGEYTVEFSIGTVKQPPLLVKAVVNNEVNISNEDFKDIPAGSYTYDVRVYDESRELVATSAYGVIQLIDTANYQL